MSKVKQTSKQNAKEAAEMVTKKPEEFTKELY